MATSFGVVLYTDRTMQQIYLVSHFAWRALIEQSGAVLLFQLANQPYEYGRLGGTPSQREAEQAVDAVSKVLSTLRAVESMDQVPWPETLPQPRPENLPFRDVQQQAVYEIALFALAYIVLHEIRHAMFVHDSNSPDKVSEERECDQFALQFLLDGVEACARTHRYEPARVLSKRAMGVFLAQVVIAEVTPFHLWGDETDHPKVIERFRAAIARVNLPVQDAAWMYACCFLLVKLRQLDRHEARIPFSSYLDLCERLLTRLSTVHSL